MYKIVIAHQYRNLKIEKNETDENLKNWKIEKMKLIKRGGCGLCLPEDMYVVQSSPSTNLQRLR